MCEAKPGPRCANDTRDAATTASAQYQTAHPDGPPVDPISAAREVEAERVRAQGHHRMLTESAAMSLDNAMGAAQSNVREARRALHNYTRHTSHGTVLGQRLRDVEQHAAELKALGHSSPAAGMDNEAFFGAMKSGPVGKVPGPQELPAPTPPEDGPLDLSSEQRHLSMMISSQVQNLDRGLRTVDYRLRTARADLREGQFQVAEGQVLGQVGQVGQDVDEASARLATLLDVAPVMGLDDRAIRRAYHQDLSRPV